MILEPIWEADFSVYSYGFRPNRSTYDASIYLGKRLIGSSGASYQWVIEGDIASYFDTIPHRRLMKAVKRRVADKDIRELLWKFLRAGVMYRGEVQETITGTPQGGVVSPLLANIYLHELDRYMESNYLNLSAEARKRRRLKGKSNYLYTRYADDFVVLCNGTKAQAHEMKEELKHVLDQMGLKLSEEKTKVTHITEGFIFLGYGFIRGTGGNGKMVPKVFIPQKAIKRYRERIKRILAPNTTKDATIAKIQAMNNVTRGWCNYYRCTSSPSDTFNMFTYELFCEMQHWLAKKYQISKTKVRLRYGQPQEGYTTLGTNRVTLTLPSTFKARKFLAKRWHNPYTEKEAILREKLLVYDSLWTGYLDDREGWSDIREEVIRLKGTICALNLPDICESNGRPLHPSEVEIDHKTPRARFKEPTEADRMKHLQPVCTSCHRAKTKIDLKVLSRMR